MEWNKLNFNVPITQSTNDSKDFIIEGTAINVGTTRNGTVFIEEELQPSAKTLRDKPVLKDHYNSVDSIVGRTTKKVDYNVEKKRIDFQARIADEKVQELITNGLINTVSVGAMVESVEENDDDTYTIHGIDFVELSLTPVPADKKATFGMAIAESIKKRKETIINNDSHLIKVKEDNSKMDNDNKVLEELETLRTEKSEREAIESRAILKEELKTEILKEMKVTAEAEEEAEVEPEAETEVEAEPEAEPEATPEAEPAEEEAEEVVEEEAEEVKEKMKGKVNNEVEETNEEINDLVITTEGVTSGYAIFQENIDKPRFKR